METQNDFSIDLLIRNLMDIHPLLSKRFKDIRAQTNLNPGSLYILGLINKHSSLTMSEIGCKLGIPKPHVTAHIDRLIRSKMVKRNYDENDRRIINITLTEKGKKDINDIFLSLSQDLKARIETLDEEKLKTFFYAVIEVKTTLAEIINDSK